MFRSNFVRCCALLGCWLTHSAAYSQLIPIANSDFSQAGNAGSETGSLLAPNYNVTMASGPWHVSGTGLLNLVASPTTTITSGTNGAGYIVGLAAVSVPLTGTIVNNSAQIFNPDIGSDFVVGQQYQLAANFASDSLLTATVLSNAGFGIGLMRNGSNLIDSTSITPASVVISILPDQRHGRITMNYTSTVTGDIGVRMFAGQGSGLANIGVLGGVSFDNVSLTAVPEPSGLALSACGLLVIGYVFYRRSRMVGLQKQQAVA